MQLPLCSVPDLGTNLITITKPILRYGAEGGFKAPPLGELMVSISYQPSLEKLTIIVVRARNLPVLDDPANANSYVKVCNIRMDKLSLNLFTIVACLLLCIVFRYHSFRMVRVLRRKNQVYSVKLPVLYGTISLALISVAMCCQSVSYNSPCCELMVISWPNARYPVRAKKNCFNVYYPAKARQRNGYHCRNQKHSTAITAS